MSAYAHWDLISELEELAEELIRGVRQQLNYYRASVYKDETARIIKYKVEKLRLIADLYGESNLIEPFSDYDATLEHGNTKAAPGECFFAYRVGQLVGAFESELQNIIKLRERSYTRQVDRRDLNRKLKRHKRELLSLCRQGTRKWAFFKTL